MCVITKVASTEFRTILAKIQAGNVSASVDIETMHDLPPETWPPKATASQMLALFSDPSATRMVFTREPLSRFRSAFMNKCNTTLTDPSCPVLPEGSDGGALSMKDAVEWMLMQNPARLEQHWLLQSEHCQLRDRVTEYTVVGRYSKENLSKDASCIMDMAGVGDFNNMGPQSTSESFWDAVAAPNPTGSDTDAQEIAELQRLFTPEAARKLIQHLRQDYETFNYPKEPAWLEGATGELYGQALILLP